MAFFLKSSPPIPPLSVDCEMSTPTHSSPQTGLSPLVCSPYYTSTPSTPVTMVNVSIDSIKDESSNVHHHTSMVQILHEEPSVLTTSTCSTVVVNCVTSTTMASSIERWSTEISGPTITDRMPSSSPAETTPLRGDKMSHASSLTVSSPSVRAAIGRSTGAVPKVFLPEVLFGPDEQGVEV